MATNPERLPEKITLFVVNPDAEKSREPYYKLINHWSENGSEVEIRRYRAGLIGKPGEGEYELKVRITPLEGGRGSKTEKISECQIMEEWVDKETGTERRRIRFYQPVAFERPSANTKGKPGPVNLFEAVEKRANENAPWIREGEEDLTKHPRAEAIQMQPQKVIQMQPKKAESK